MNFHFLFLTWVQGVSQGQSIDVIIYMLYFFEERNSKTRAKFIAEICKISVISLISLNK